MALGLRAPLNRCAVVVAFTSACLIFEKPKEPEPPPRVIEVRGMPLETTATARVLWVPPDSADKVIKRSCKWYNDTLVVVAAANEEVEIEFAKGVNNTWPDWCGADVYACSAWKQKFNSAAVEKMVGIRRQTLRRVKGALDVVMSSALAALDTASGRLSAEGVYQLAGRDSLNRLIILAKGTTPVMAMFPIDMDTTLIPWDKDAFRPPHVRCPDNTKAAKYFYLK